MDKITFEASVYKISTLVDFGLRLTLDLPEDAVAQAAQLMECKRQGIALTFEAKSSEPANTDKKRK